MTRIVQKFGGSSLATPDRIRSVAARVVGARRTGAQVVVVVSAMGNTTDNLAVLAQEVNPNPPAREMDMLLTAGERISTALTAMAIAAYGVEAVSLTGSQAGILTDDTHGAAKIQGITGARVTDNLAEGRVVIVAGFQGVSPRSKEITTLGRGGSDTSAVALAAALGGDVAEIYTDVPGVMTADPRIVPEAQKLDEVSYEVMMELAAGGGGDRSPGGRGWSSIRRPDPRTIFFYRLARHLDKKGHPDGANGTSHSQRNSPRRLGGEGHPAGSPRPTGRGGICLRAAGGGERER